MEKKQEFTLSIFTENQVGMLQRVSIIFTRRKLNIESITASTTEIKGIYRYTIVCNTTTTMIKKVVQQLEKQVEISKALYYTSDQVVYEELALYKIAIPFKNNGLTIEQIVRNNHARILSMESDFMVIEKTGTREETQELYELLVENGILEFARSGRVAVTKPMKELGAFLKEMENNTEYKETYN